MATTEIDAPFSPVEEVVLTANVRRVPFEGCECKIRLHRARADDSFTAATFRVGRVTTPREK